MNFVDIIGTVIDAVRAEWDEVNDPVKTPFYLYGHPIEIFNILSKKSKHQSYKFDKYPLIALFQDFEEDTNSNRTIVQNITIVIMVETDPNFIAPSRYSATFIPTLQPLYELFIKHLKKSKYLASEEDYQHTKIDRLYWGKEDTFGNSGNIGNDALDAVVINGLNLRIIKCK